MLVTTRLLVNGRIYSSFAPDATSIAITDGTVVWVGDERAGRALHPAAEIEDLGGAFVTPGFVDTHVHITALGLNLVGLDLVGATSLDECLSRVRTFAVANPETAHPDAVIWGHGWDDTEWADQTPPSTADLDAAAPGRKVYLSRIDVHSAACSSALRDGISGLADTAGYSADGPLTFDAHHLARNAARNLLTESQRASARTAALDLCASRGIVAVHECGGPDISGLTDFQELLAHDHGVEVRGYWGERVDTEEDARALLDKTGADGLGGDLFIDGSLGSHTAWLLEPYADQPDSTGNAYLDVDAIAAHIRACTLAGVQAGFHAIGDGAVSSAAAAFRKVADELGGPKVAALGHRLEHAEMMSMADAETFAALG
ncbi:amidohydrolase family protein, partial [Rhodococcus erythropolis]|nr:amidohydrolase family protein [Rhodococcus erythropolis]